MPKDPQDNRNNDHIQAGDKPGIPRSGCHQSSLLKAYGSIQRKSRQSDKTQVGAIECPLELYQR